MSQKINKTINKNNYKYFIINELQFLNPHNIL
jgi:hypothetical protein